MIALRKYIKFEIFHLIYPYFSMNFIFQLLSKVKNLNVVSIYKIEQGINLEYF